MPFFLEPNFCDSSEIRVDDIEIRVETRVFSLDKLCVIKGKIHRYIGIHIKMFHRFFRK